MFIDDKGYLHASHSVSNILLHSVFIPKYRHDCLRAKVAEDCDFYIRQVAEQNSIFIKELNVRPDHIHALYQIPPSMSPAESVMLLKMHSSRLLRNKYGILKDHYEGGLYSRGYFTRSQGAGSIEDTIAYIQNQ